MLDITGSPRLSYDYRIQKVESYFWAHSKALCGPGSVATKLRAWHRGLATSAMHGSKTWHSNKSISSTMKVWECRLLRKMFRLMRAPDEGCMAFNRTTANRICQWAQLHRVKFLHHRALLSVFEAAWREREFSTPGGIEILCQLQRYRDRSSWEEVKHESTWLRTQHSSNMGPRAEWENLLVLVFGAGWRAMRSTCAT